MSTVALPLNPLLPLQENFSFSGFPQLLAHRSPFPKDHPIKPPLLPLPFTSWASHFFRASPALTLLPSLPLPCLPKAHFSLRPLRVSASLPLILTVPGLSRFQRVVRVLTARRWKFKAIGSPWVGAQEAGRGKGGATVAQPGCFIRGAKER